MVSDAISEHLIFKIFLGGMPPDPPSKSMLRMLSVLRTLFDHLPPLLYGLSHSPWLYRLIFPSYGPVLCHSSRFLISNFLASTDIKVFGRTYLFAMLLLIGLALFLHPKCFCLAYYYLNFTRLYSVQNNSLTKVDKCPNKL